MAAHSIVRDMLIAYNRGNRVGFVGFIVGLFEQGGEYAGSHG